jgi:anti-repressor protein
MKDLITVTKREGQDVVSMKELYQFLDLASAVYSRWVNTHLLSNDKFREGVDYVEASFVISVENPKGGRPTKDYALSLNTAKQLALKSATNKGYEIRQWFIDRELKLQKVELTPFAMPTTLLEAAELWLAELEKAQQLNTI